jgi:16S rRNA (guanine527-N7)-methyltransferase
VTNSVLKYFPNLSETQIERFSCLKDLYTDWNSKINVISRKDMDNFYIHHVLHSLSIAVKFDLEKYSTVLDVGTGGGFPGIPLAIMFPQTEFTLADSIEKKIKVVAGISSELGLNNVKPLRTRIEEHKGKYNFVVSRAVTEFSTFVKWTSKNIASGPDENGIIYLKGGDLDNELACFKNEAIVTEIRDFFNEPFFETKKIVYLPASFFQKKRATGS